MTTPIEALEARLAEHIELAKSMGNFGVASRLCAESLATIRQMREALGEAERKIVGLYDGIAPQAHYENELGINGHHTGNRHADNDETVQRVRAALNGGSDHD